MGEVLLHRSSRLPRLLEWHSGGSLLTPTPASDPEKLHRIFIEYMIIQIILLVSPTGVARQAPP